MRQGIVHDEMLQHLVHEQTSQLRQLNSQLQEEIRKRQLLEEKLKTSEAKIRAVFEAMTDIVLVINTQENQIKEIEIIPTSSNRLYECECDIELIDKTVKEFLQDKAENTWFKSVREALDKKQTLNFDYSLSIKGCEVWFSASLSPISDKSVVWVARDITDRKQAEEELRQSEERWRLVLQGSQDGIWDRNLKTNEIFRSARWKEILGYEDHEIPNKYEEWIARIHPDDVDQAMQAREDYLARKIPSYAVEYRLQCKDGSYKWVLMRSQAVWDESASPVRMVGAMTDINERKIAEERLQLLERAIAASNNGIMISDAQAPDNPVIYANSGFERITGYTKEEVIGKNCRFLQGTDTAQPALEELKRAISEARETQVVLRNYRKDGTLFWNQLCLTPVQDDTGCLTHFIGIQTDISERKQAEEALRQSEAREREKAQALERAYRELKRTQAQLIQAEKMSSLGQMIAGIAHEINNPTSFIYGNINPAIDYTQDLLHLIELYRQHYPEPVAEITEQLQLIELDFIADDFPKLLASMQEGAQRINQIVLSLRNFSRLDESESKRVDIHEGIDNTLLILKHRLKQQSKRPEIRVIKEYGQLPPVECYPGQLNQVFMNIISNAIDALDEAIEKETSFEPTIRIRTEVVKTDLPSSHSNAQSVSRVLISIVDNSPSSIKAELLPKIFDPFFTTKPVGSGRGLGLSISYQIVVDRHQGQLRCYSTPGVGTEFAIALPIRPPA